jgi:DUF1680 family protein
VNSVKLGQLSDFRNKKIETEIGTIERKGVSMKGISININDNFWSTYTKLIRDEVIPYQWDALNDNVADAEPSAAIRNFRIAAGEEEGEFYGMVFQDSDVAKWLEAVAYSLETYPDPVVIPMEDRFISTPSTLSTRALRIS